MGSWRETGTISKREERIKIMGAAETGEIIEKVQWGEKKAKEEETSGE